MSSVCQIVQPLFLIMNKSIITERKILVTCNVLCLQGLVEVEVEAQVEMVTGLASKLMLTF